MPEPGRSPAGEPAGPGPGPAELRARARAPGPPRAAPVRLAGLGGVEGACWAAWAAAGGGRGAGVAAQRLRPPGEEPAAAAGEVSLLGLGGGGGDGGGPPALAWAPGPRLLAAAVGGRVHTARAHVAADGERLVFERLGAWADPDAVGAEGDADADNGATPGRRWGASAAARAIRHLAWTEDAAGLVAADAAGRCRMLSVRGGAVQGVLWAEELAAGEGPLAWVAAPATCLGQVAAVGDPDSPGARAVRVLQPFKPAGPSAAGPLRVAQQRLGHGAAVRCAAWSPRQRLLVTGTGDKHLRVWLNMRAAGSFDTDALFHTRRGLAGGNRLFLLTTLTVPTGEAAAAVGWPPMPAAETAGDRIEEKRVFAAEDATGAVHLWLVQLDAGDANSVPVFAYWKQLRRDAGGDGGGGGDGAPGRGPAGLDCWVQGCELFLYAYDPVGLRAELSACDCFRKRSEFEKGEGIEPRLALDFAGRRLPAVVALAAAPPAGDWVLATHADRSLSLWKVEEGEEAGPTDGGEAAIALVTPRVTADVHGAAFLPAGRRGGALRAAVVKAAALEVWAIDRATGAAAHHLAFRLLGAPGAGPPTAAAVQPLQDGFSVVVTHAARLAVYYVHGLYLLQRSGDPIDLEPVHLAQDAGAAPGCSTFANTLQGEQLGLAYVERRGPRRRLVVLDLDYPDGPVAEVARRLALPVPDGEGAPAFAASANGMYVALAEGDAGGSAAVQVHERLSSLGKAFAPEGAPVALPPGAVGSVAFAEGAEQLPTSLVVLQRGSGVHVLSHVPRRREWARVFAVAEDGGGAAALFFAAGALFACTGSEICAFALETDARAAAGLCAEPFRSVPALLEAAPTAAGPVACAALLRRLHDPAYALRPELLGLWLMDGNLRAVRAALQAVAARLAGAFDGEAWRPAAGDPEHGPLPSRAAALAVLLDAPGPAAAAAGATAAALMAGPTGGPATGDQFTAAQRDALAALARASAAPDALAPYVAVGEALHHLDATRTLEGLDAAARHVYIAFLLRHVFPAESAAAASPEEALAPVHLAFGMLSESPDALFAACQQVAAAAGRPPEAAFAQSGAAFWLGLASLKKEMERVAKAQFLRRRDPQECALLYIAMGKTRVLAALCRTAGQPHLLAFFSRNFGDEANRAAALKNAYVLLSQHRYELCAGFFLLAGAPADACEVLCDQARNPALAFAVARLHSNDGGDLPATFLGSKAVDPEEAAWMAAIVQLHRGESAAAVARAFDVFAAAGGGGPRTAVHVPAFAKVVAEKRPSAAAPAEALLAEHAPALCLAFLRQGAVCARFPALRRLAEAPCLAALVLKAEAVVHLALLPCWLAMERVPEDACDAGALEGAPFPAYLAPADLEHASRFFRARRRAAPASSPSVVARVATSEGAPELPARNGWDSGAVEAEPARGAGAKPLDASRAVTSSSYGHMLTCVCANQTNPHEAIVGVETSGLTLFKTGPLRKSMSLDSMVSPRGSSPHGSNRMSMDWEPEESIHAFLSGVYHDRKYPFDNWIDDHPARTNTVRDVPAWVLLSVSASEVESKCLASHPARDVYLSGSKTSSLYLWQYNQNSAMASFTSPNTAAGGRSLAICFHALGHKFVSVSEEGLVAVWDLDEGGSGSRLSLDEKSARGYQPETIEFFKAHISAHFLSGSSTLLMTGAAPGSGRNLAVWDSLAGPGPVLTTAVDLGDDAVNNSCPLWGTDRVALTGRGGTVGVVDLRMLGAGTTKPVWARREAHGRGATELCVPMVPGADGAAAPRFFTGGKDTVVKAWDPQGGEELQQIDCSQFCNNSLTHMPTRPLISTGVPGINGLAYSPGGGLFATCGENIVALPEEGVGLRRAAP